MVLLTYNCQCSVQTLNPEQNPVYLQSQICFGGIESALAKRIRLGDLPAVSVLSTLIMLL